MLDGVFKKMDKLFESMSKGVDEIFKEVDLVFKKIEENPGPGVSKITITVVKTGKKTVTTKTWVKDGKKHTMITEE
jgi:hypothetical protein